MRAYNLTKKDPILQDCVNDGEHGGGKIILKVVQEKDINNKVVFIIRNYGKVK